jgi:hypothetical protein
VIGAAARDFAMRDIAAKIISDAQKVAAMKRRDHFSSCRPNDAGTEVTREMRKSPLTVPTRLATAAGAGERHATFGFPNRRLPNAPLDHAALWRSQSVLGKSSEK